MSIKSVGGPRVDTGAINSGNKAPAKETPAQVLTREARSREVVSMPGLKVRVTHTPGTYSNFAMRRVDISVLGAHAFSNKVDVKAARQEEHARRALNREHFEAQQEAHLQKMLDSEPASPHGQEQAAEKRED